MKTFFSNNRNKLIEDLAVGDLVVLFAGEAPKSTADSHYRFKTNKNFYYFTGFTQEKFIVTIVKLKDKVETMLFIEEANYDIEKWVGRKLSKTAATEVSGIETVEYLDKFRPYITRLVYQDKVERAYFDLEKLSWDQPDSYTHQFAKDFRDKFLQVQIKTLHPLVTKYRLFKEEFELDCMKQAIELTDKGLKAILNTLEPGKFEYELESAFDYAIMSGGADGNAFDTIAASGSEAVILHYVDNNRPLKENELVLLDLGAQYKEYAGDISRTYPISGKFTDRQKLFYNLVLEAQLATIDAIEVGKTLAELNDVCKNVLTDGLKEIGLIKEDSEISKYYYHGVSHFLGLDTHDLGERDVKLEPGMVITVEPGLYIAEEEIGIRIEDDCLVTENGHINLSSMIIKTVEDIESALK